MVISYSCLDAGCPFGKIAWMIGASKTSAFTAFDLFLNPELIKKVQELIATKGDYQYKALLGDRKPALNYRD